LSLDHTFYGFFRVNIERDRLLVVVAAGDVCEPVAFRPDDYVYYPNE
jgi:hypothetical protein